MKTSSDKNEYQSDIPPENDQYERVQVDDGSEQNSSGRSEAMSLVANDEDHGQPIAALQMLRDARRFSPMALGLGVLSRAMVTLCTSFEDAASIADLFLTYTRFFLIFIFILIVFFGVGSTAVTWGFWTPQVQDYTAEVVQRALGCCAQPTRPREGEGAEGDAEFEEEAGCIENVQTSLPWLSYVTISCSLATLGLVANENVEGTRMMLGWASPTWGLGIFGLVTGVIAAVYSGFTDLDSVWQTRWTNSTVVTLRRPPTTTIFVVTFLGTVELFYRTWIVIYLTSLELNDSRALAFVLSSFFTICGTIQNFCFQTSYALEGSSFLRSVRLAMVRMPIIPKIIFLGLIGLTTVIVNMSMPTFNISTLLPLIFTEFLGITLSSNVVMGISIGVAAGITWGDLLSGFWGGVVRQTMGWDQPDNLFLHRQRPQTFQMGFFHRRGAQGAQRSTNSDRVTVLGDEEAVELKRVEQSGKGGQQDFGANYDFGPE